jgi:hypothetical protein
MINHAFIPHATPVSCFITFYNSGMPVGLVVAMEVVLLLLLPNTVLLEVGKEQVGEIASK